MTEEAEAYTLLRQRQPATLLNLCERARMGCKMYSSVHDLVDAQRKEDPCRTRMKLHHLGPSVKYTRFPGIWQLRSEVSVISYDR